MCGSVKLLWNLDSWLDVKFLYSKVFLIVFFILSNSSFVSVILRLEKIACVHFLLILNHFFFSYGLPLVYESECFCYQCLCIYIYLCYMCLGGPTVECIIFISVCRCVHTQLCMYAYLRGEFNRFPDIFVQAFKIVVDS